MPANTTPIFGKTPNVSSVLIPTTNAQVKSDGTSAGSANDNLYVAFTAGANGSWIDRVRFFSVANAATTGVATVLRVYLSSVNSAPSATTNANTHLLGEISVPAVPSANATNATSPYEIPLGFAIPSGTYVLVGQHTAQTTNQAWKATAIGSDY